MTTGPATRSLWRDALKRLMRNRAAVVGGVILIVIALVAIFAPLIAPSTSPRGV